MSSPAHEAAPRQPLLSDAIIVLRAPTQVWSRTTGDLADRGIDGMYHGDTRYVASLSTTCDGELPEWISTVEEGPSRVVFGGLIRHLDDPTPDPKIRIQRERTALTAGVHDAITVTSNLDRAVATRLQVRLTPEFAPLATVKAGAPRPEASVTSVAGGAPEAVVHATSGGRSAAFTSPGADVSLDEGDVVFTWDLHIDATSSTTVHLRVEFADGEAVVVGVASETGWPRLEDASDPRVGRWLARALGDLDALRLALPAHPEDEFFAAGAPWFFTLFGRDAIWAARLLLPLDVGMAASTLRVLARLQGSRRDPATAEQPGKILHELRSAPLAMPGEGILLPPVYYGTVDATPLWVCLLADAWEAGMPEREVRALVPALRAALSWITDHGDRFLDYRDESGQGLANQGWKDSGDSIQWRDGSLARGPIALCEVQGYAYEATVAGARLLDALGEPGGAVLREWAARLRERFAASFWVHTEEGRYPAVALDAEKLAVDTLTSNIGHLIGTGILDPADERDIAALLTGESMLSGYGIRTMSTGARGYWPLSYHGGAVWAHDTAIIARGMARAGLSHHADIVVANLLAAAEGFAYRVPELHSGDSDRQSSAPTPYPAACRPQAWSAAAAVTVADIVSASAAGPRSR